MTARCTDHGGCRQGHQRCATPYRCGMFQRNGGHHVNGADDMPIQYAGPEDEEAFERSVRRDLWLTVVIALVIAALYGASRWFN